MSAAVYRFRSRKQLDQARADLLSWYLAHDAQDLGQPFDSMRFLAGLSPDSPLANALREGGTPDTVATALVRLRAAIRMAEQQFGETQSFEQILAAALDANARFASTGSQPVQEAPVRRRRRGPVRKLLLLLVGVALAWICGRGLEIGLERRAVAATLVVPAVELTGALSALSLSLPAHVSACRATGRQVCPLTTSSETTVVLADAARRDLARAHEAAGLLLAVLGRLDSQVGSGWAVTVPGEPCPTPMLTLADSDRAVVQGLCRFRERAVEYMLCLEGHPVLTDRHCADLMRLATIDTIFDCTDCGERPSNVFARQFEWRLEMQAASKAATGATSLAALAPLVEILEGRLEEDVRSAVNLSQRFAGQVLR